jgi:eukaryotic-like serine/threonine-protein kinase
MATSPEKWQTVKAWFDAALELDSGARAAFLRENCPDAEARAEVERLLNEHDEAGRFLSNPVLGNFPLETDAPASTQRLSEGEVLAGRFRIVRFIAGGGMGEVYEAEDQELKDRVAIKTIRPEILAQPNALTRFKREVRLARQVTHPNVCRIFDLFRHRGDDRENEDVVFIGMELLQGKTLGARLEEGGRMSMQEALPLVRQMASALAAAHAAGIVHRDFKPGNVVLAGAPEQYRAVVTDFGLALRSLSSEKDATASTVDGAWGTPAYMAPEQLEGRPATTGSDIYALGLVIYEMVTGARPFDGDTPISAALKRLSETPTPPRKFQPNLSPVWESVILQCLERDPEKRFANAADVVKALDVDRLPAAVSKLSVWPRPLAGARAAKERRWGGAALVIAALFVLGAGGFGVYYLLHRPTAPFQNFTITQVTNLGNVTWAAISPDAKFVVSLNDDNGAQSLWLHNVPTTSDTQFMRPTSSSYGTPEFSPDGDYIYYRKEGDSGFDLYRTPVLGGSPQKLVHDIDTEVTFSPDRRHLAYFRYNNPETGKYRLLTATLEGNDEKVLQIGPAADQVLHPVWSPSGSQIAYRVRHPDNALTGIDVFDVKSGKSHRLATFQDKIVTTLTWSPDGRGIFFNYYPMGAGLGGQIGWLSSTGKDFRRVTHDTNIYFTLSASADGKTLATAQTESTSNVYLLPGTGSRSAQADSLPLQVRTKADIGLTWSHDGNLLSSDGTRLWRMERDGGNASVLVADPKALVFNQSACGSQYLVFTWSYHEGAPVANVWRANVDGSNSIRLTAGKLDYHPICSPDRKWVYYSDETNEKIMRVLLDGSGKPEVVPGSGNFSGSVSGEEMDFSPDGRTFAYLVSVTSPETPAAASKVALLSLESPNSLRLLDVSPHVSGGVQFTPDAKSVAYSIRENGVDNLWVQPLDGSAPHQITNFSSERIGMFHWSPDGKNLALFREHSESDVVLLQETNP